MQIQNKPQRNKEYKEPFQCLVAHQTPLRKQFVKMFSIETKNTKS